MTKRILAAALAFASAGAFAQTAISLNSITVPVTENFDALPSTLNTTGAALPLGATGLTGVFVSTQATTDPVLRVGSGQTNSGSFYSLGAEGIAERALGTVGSNSATQLFTGIRIRNNTSSAISSFYFEFILEQFRSSTTGATATGDLRDGLNLSYRLLDNTVTDATFQASLRDNTLWSNEKLSTSYFNGSNGFATSGTAVQAPTFGAAGAFIPAPILGAADPNGQIDGNAEANRRKVESFILLGNTSGGTAFQSILPGQDIAIRFRDTNSVGSDGALGIDSFAAVPEPASMAALALGFGAIVARRRRK